MSEKKLVKVAQTFRWEMGHRLPHHSGGCRNLHGHSYKMVVELTGWPRNDGMVIDYYDIKSEIKPLVAALDHCFLCSADDELMAAFLKTVEMKTVYVDFPSTAENIALYFLAAIRSGLKHHENLRSVAVRVYETENEYAEVSADFRK